MTRQYSLARFLPLPENQAAYQAVQDLAEGIKQGKTKEIPNPVFLHGPSGIGKTHLTQALANRVAQQLPVAKVTSLSGADFRLEIQPNPDRPRLSSAPWPFMEAARQHELLTVEDLQHLPPYATETFLNILDQRGAHGLPTLVTAACGPRHLQWRDEQFSARLTNRLAGGLVIGLAPLQGSSRFLLLQEFAQRRLLAVPVVVLQWLADQLVGGPRQLQGAIEQLIALGKMHHRLTLPIIQDHFRMQVEASKPTLERIAQQVSGYYRIAPFQLRSLHRTREVLRPRQIGMYLARRLTSLSLNRIGHYFGGRDHTTVLHACRKVHEAMSHDPVLAGAVYHLQAELA